MTTRHFLLLVPKSFTPMQRTAYADDVKRTLESTLPGLNATTMDSIVWYEKSFARCGSWDAWTWDAVNGRDYGYSSPRFDGFVVPAEQVGRASAMILELALRNKRFCAMIRESGGEVQPITRIDKNASESWLDGWDVRVAEAVV